MTEALLKGLVAADFDGMDLIAIDNAGV